MRELCFHMLPRTANFAGVEHFHMSSSLWLGTSLTNWQLTGNNTQSPSIRWKQVALQTLYTVSWCDQSNFPLVVRNGERKCYPSRSRGIFPGTFSQQTFFTFLIAFSLQKREELQMLANGFKWAFFLRKRTKTFIKWNLIITVSFWMTTTMEKTRSSCPTGWWRRRNMRNTTKNM